MTKQTAWEHVVKAMREIAERTAEDAEALQRIEVERLDRLLDALWTAAIAGDCGAVDRVLKIAERRSKLLGLDAPTRTDATVEARGPTFVEHLALALKDGPDVD